MPTYFDGAEFTLPSQIEIYIRESEGNVFRGEINYSRSLSEQQSNGAYEDLFFNLDEDSLYANIRYPVEIFNSIWMLISGSDKKKFKLHLEFATYQDGKLLFIKDETFQSLNDCYLPLESCGIVCTK